MKFYLAPLEGITGSIFRNTVNAMFGESIDKFFTPFIVPHLRKSITKREKAELAKENNKDLYLVPQILTKSAKDFLATEEKLRDIGYNEINLNLGCPSGTVTAKGRGAGALKDPEALERLLEEIFAGSKSDISLKVRIGYDLPDEFFRLLEIFNKYPVKELIIHPRVKAEMYRGNVHLEMFRYAVENSKAPLCYNGDITSKEGYDKIINEFPHIPAVMIGRGMVADPALIRHLSGGNDITDEERKEFLERIKESYMECFKDERQTLCKLKEIWSYVGPHINCGPKPLKKVMKSKSIAEYELRAFQALDEAKKTG